MDTDKPYRAEVIADSSGEWVGNGLRFPTEEKAIVYARDLSSRWTLVRNWRIVKETPTGEDIVCSDR